MQYAIDKGHYLVNSDHTYTYINYTYEVINMQKAYGFNPIPEGLTTEQQKQILGQGYQMWGEWTPSDKEVEYQTYPRLAAYADTAWLDPSKKDYSRFREALPKLMNYWKAKGYNIAPLEVVEICMPSN